MQLRGRAARRIRAVAADRRTCLVVDSSCRRLQTLPGLFAALASGPSGAPDDFMESPSGYSSLPRDGARSQSPDAPQNFAPPIQAEYVQRRSAWQRCGECRFDLSCAVACRQPPSAVAAVNAATAAAAAHPHIQSTSVVGRARAPAVAAAGAGAGAAQRLLDAHPAV